MEGITAKSNTNGLDFVPRETEVEESHSVNHKWRMWKIVTIDFSGFGRNLAACAGRPSITK